MQAYIDSILPQAQKIYQDILNPSSVEFKFIFYPVIAYWVLAASFDVLDRLKLSFTERFRIRRVEPGKPNGITVSHVVIRVFWQHIIQVSITIVALVFDDKMCAIGNQRPGWIKSTCLFIFGLFVMDTYQYFVHRYMHTNTYLYKKLHSTHHRLLKPYAYGALYNHPLEALILDTLGGVITHYAARLTCNTAVAVMTFATVKTVLDHCGYRFPINPLHNVFPNSTAYHDVHHDIRFIKTNFSQPFFTHWDILLGTYKNPAEVHVQTNSQDSDASAAISLKKRK
uniref:Fatty acid hydroxylase domain-containing protein n=1 Tax=Polytomella parva TaxID=51329 RepID=A0A7S0V8Y2_9CHLO|mmetsp:Transcript_32883/g.59565  ORF Transcript_32883/g.59565 Transcript_32883/m.59565 type:complete len:283 (+) Transcript_32883:90-938(+)